MGFLGRLFTIDIGGEETSNKKFRLFKDNKITYIKNLSRQVETEIEELKEYIHSFNNKVSLLKKYAHTGDEKHLKELRKLIRKIEKIVYTETSMDSKEGKLALKLERSIRHQLNKEKNKDFQNDEAEIRQELVELRIDSEELLPVLESQMKFFASPLKEQKKRIKELYSDIHKEADIIGYEKKYLKELKESIDKYEVDAVVED